MLSVDEDALICDLAETYGIFDYRQLPVKLVATLVVGLGTESRIKRKMSGMSMTTNEAVLFSILDHLKILVWQNTKDGQRNRNRPKLILEEINKMASHSQVQSFNSAEEFEEAKRKILNGGDLHGE